MTVKISASAMAAALLRRLKGEEVTRKFSALLQYDCRLPLDVQQQEASEVFPQIVELSNLVLFAPENVCVHSSRIVIGVATYSIYDMSLLDRIDVCADTCFSGVSVEVFDIVDTYDKFGGFDHIFPGIEGVYQTPVVGVWNDGVLIERASGENARDLISKVLGISAL